MPTRATVPTIATTLLEISIPGREPIEPFCEEANTILS
jgi:hypothetical protein